MTGRSWAGIVVSMVLVGGCVERALKRVRPDHGSVVGGDLVRLEGRGFATHGPPVVYFGAAAAKGVVIESDQLIVVFAPKADAPGSVPIRVVFRDGTVIEWPDAYRYTLHRGFTIEPKPQVPTTPPP